MEPLLQWIEHVRASSEARRHRMFLILVSGGLVIIGAAWAVTLPWQFSAPTETDTQALGEMSEDTGILPSLGELLSRGKAQASDTFKEKLRDVLLTEQEEQPQAPKSSSGEAGAPVRLPQR